MGFWEFGGGLREQGFIRDSINLVTFHYAILRSRFQGENVRNGSGYLLNTKMLRERFLCNFTAFYNLSKWENKRRFCKKKHRTQKGVLSV
jgi:hypothetical protein